MDESQAEQERSDADAPSPRPRGRRRNRAGENARATIVAAAGDEFAGRGYDSASLRNIARRAGVDAALVHHYFSDKAELFTETLKVPVRPDLLVAEVLKGPRADVGANLVRGILSRLDDRAVAGRAVGLIRVALGHDFAATMLRQFLVREVVGKIVAGLGVDDGELRAGLVASQVLGLIAVRYGIRVEPLASAPAETVVARVGPVLQWHMVDFVDTGDPIDQ